MSSKSLSSVTIIYAIGNLASKLISFVLVFFITFYLTKEDVGRYDIIITTISLFIPLLNLQLADGILRWLLECNDDLNKTKVLTNSLLIFSLNSIVFTLLYWIIVPFIQDDYILIIYVLLLVQSLFPLIQIFTRGVGNNILFAISGVVYSFIYTGFTLISLLLLNLKIDGLLIANVFALIATIVFVFIFGKMKYFINIKAIDIKFIKEIVKYTLPTIPNSYSWWLFSSANRYIILYFLGLEFAGIWAISYKLPTILTIFTSLFFMAWQEKSIKEFNSPNRDEYFSRVLKIFISLMLGLIIVIVASSKTILYFIVEESFFISWKYTSLLLFASFFQTLSLFYSVGYLYAKETKKILYTTLIGSLASVIFGLLLVPFLGLFGAGIASLIGFFVMFFIRLKQTKIYFNIKFPIYKTLILILAILISNGLNYFDSFYIQGINIFYGFIVFYLANYIFINSKIKSTKILILNKYHERK